MLPRAGFIAQRRGEIVLRPDSEHTLPYVLGAEQYYQQVGEGKKVPTVFRDPTVRCEMPRQMSRNYFWMKEEQNPKTRLPNREYLRMPQSEKVEVTRVTTTSRHDLYTAHITSMMEECYEFFLEQK